MAGIMNVTYKRENEVASVSDEKLGEIHLVSEDESGTLDYFEAARLDREISRAEAVETLNEIINTNKDESSKQAAQDSIINLANISEKENTIESLIKAQGYEDAVVFINDGKASVVVKSKNMTPEQATVISEIVSVNAGVDPTNIKITEVLN
jgi:stage III sporulation protein AH